MTGIDDYGHLQRMAERHGIKPWTEDAFAVLDEVQQLRADNVVLRRAGAEMALYISDLQSGDSSRQRELDRMVVAWEVAADRPAVTGPTEEEDRG